MMEIKSIPLSLLLLAMGDLYLISPRHACGSVTLTCEAFAPAPVVFPVGRQISQSALLPALLAAPSRRLFASRRVRTTAVAMKRRHFSLTSKSVIIRNFSESDDEGGASSLYSVASENFSRADFISRSLVFSLATLTPVPIAFAFEGGVGGLGKTRPETGVVFRDAEAALAAVAGGGGSGMDVTNELLAPNGTPALVTFSSPWPLLRSSMGIESRDILGGFESAFVLVAKIPNGRESASLSSEDLKPSFLSDVIFGSAGKFGMYGSPYDIKIKKLLPASGSGGTGTTTIYVATFTTLTPAMRESDRKAYVSASVVGDGAFLLVTTTTTARFKKLEETMRKVAESFAAVPAPKSSLRGGNASTSGSMSASSSSS